MNGAFISQSHNISNLHDATIPYTGPSVSLHVSITVAPENTAKFLDLLKPVYDLVSAEPECVFFEVFQNPAVPGEFKFVENWHATVEWVRDVRASAVHP